MNLKEESYSTKLRVKASDAHVFEALSTKIGDWWGDQDKPARQKGDVFTMSWGEPWYQFQVVECIPNQSIYWECIDANQIIGDLDGVQKEWVGTQLQWTINQLNENEVELHFLHKGLVPKFICYEFCSNTWDRFITFNLKKYLEKG